MATLQQKLKMGGQQSSVSEEEMQNLARKTGRAAVPTTPLEGSVIGGNKDQAKMMGSKASLRSTISNLGSTPDSLQTAQRTAQVRRDATTSEQEKLDKAASIDKLSSLDSRVQNIATGLINQAGQAAATSGQLALSEAGAELDPESQQLLTTLQAAAPGSPEALEAARQLNLKMGRTAANLLGPEELKGYFQSNAAQLGAEIAANTADNITVADLPLVDMGFTDSAELAAILGVDPAEIGNLDITALQDKINATIQSEYSRVSELEQRANDPAVSAAERAQARKELREAGAIGVRSTETAIDKLADQIENSDTVEFDGREMEITELLNDETLSGLAAKYLEENPLDPTWKETFRENNPDLANWLDQNSEVLSDAVAGIDDTVKELAAIQEDNKKLATASSGTTLSDEVASIVIPGYGELSAQRVDASATPVLSVLQGKNETHAQNVAEGLEFLHDVDPELAAELAAMDQSGMINLGVLNDTSTWKTVEGYLSDAKKIAEIPEGDTQTFFKEMMGTGDLNKVTETFQDLINRKNSGLFTEENPMSEFLPYVTDANGRLLPPDQMASNLRQIMGKKSLAEIMSKPSGFQSLSQKLAESNQYRTLQNPVYDKYKDAFTDDGVISPEEFHTAIGQKSRGRWALPRASDYGPHAAELLNSGANVDPSLRNLLVTGHARSVLKPAVEAEIRNLGLPMPAEVGRARTQGYAQMEQVASAINLLRDKANKATGWEKEAAQRLLKDTQAEYRKKMYPPSGGDWSSRNLLEDVARYGRDFFEGDPLWEQRVAIAEGRA